MNKAGKQYLKQVKAHLTCPGKLKKKFLAQMQGDVAEFLETNPDASVQDLMERFGQPSQLAHSYIDSLDADELNKQIRKSKIVKRIVLFTCLAIILFVLTATAIIVIATVTSTTTVVTVEVQEDQTVITGASEMPVNQELTTDIDSNASIVIDGTVEEAVSYYNQ